ncbi:hypothetical protein [Sphingomonas lycopersici]|uniref:Uncharacterized protein n=1 Tax=Sphingomonas lycopersici TaxID=2951807 RepID=A0AA42CQI1_9SPHN|nr:hypothetical protein [Sphingomonas lycopersici]MCW6534947.1 hypothetical protein [Sphingomonas lycopersici]
MSILPSLFLAIPAVVMAGGLAPAKRPDFSAVTSVAAARKLVADGYLVESLAFPAELGGPPDKENIIYLPPAVVTTRALVIGTLKRMSRDGSIDRMKVEPDYRGDSIVPARLRMTAWRSGEKTKFEAVIEVW